MYKNIVILTGAGISAESGISTFRGNEGLWSNYRIEDVATYEGFIANPVLVYDFYNNRRAALKDAFPNSAHIALAELEKKVGNVYVVTQNVDDLHEKAGTKNLVHMHGELLKIKCMTCGVVFHTESSINIDSICPECGQSGTLRPDIVWFGEVPKHMNFIETLLLQCDLFISIGTSGVVYPAANFIRIVQHADKAHTVELNLKPSGVGSLFHERIYGKASEVVPSYISKILQL